MKASEQDLRTTTRRQFFNRCGLGFGSIALASIMGDKVFAADAPKLVNPFAPKPPHFPARAKNIIYLFMAGGLSQLELFDYKPKLVELNGQSIPQSFLEGKRFAFMGRAFGGERLALRPRGADIWEVFLGPDLLGQLHQHDRSRSLRPARFTR